MTPIMRLFIQRFWHNLRKLLRNMASSVKSAANLVFLLILFITIFSLLGMQLFGGRFTFSTITRTNFDSFIQSVFTVFQIVISEDWNVIMNDGIRSYDSNYGIICAIYFIALYIMGNYILLNVFLAIALNNLRNKENDEDISVDDSNKLVTSETTTTTAVDSDMSAKDTAMTSADINNNMISVIKFEGKTKEPIFNERISSIEYFERTTVEDSLYENITYDEFYAEETTESIEDDLIKKDNSDKPNVKKIPSGSSCFIFKFNNKFRIQCHKIVTHQLCMNIVLTLIIISSLMLALEDPVKPNSNRNMVLQKFDIFFTTVFTLEILIKMVAYGIILHKNAFLRNGFNWMDFIVVLTSLIDNIISSNSGASAIKILRVVRVLRPLRAISRARGLKHVIRSLVMAFKAVGQIVLIIFLLEFMFAVIAVILLKGSFYSCNDLSKITNGTCRGQFHSYSMDGRYTANVQTRSWSNNPFNYDNVANAMLTLFIVSTFSAWKLFLFKSIDATGENLGPYLDNNRAISLFYFAFIITIALFTLNIFIGMVIVTFRREKDSEYAKCRFDKNQRNCISFVLKARPRLRYVPNYVARFRIWKFVKSMRFHYIIVGFILLNTVCLASKYMDQTKELTDAMSYLNILFIGVFTSEIILKMYALNILNFFNESMNIFDVLVVLGSYVDMVFSTIQNNENSVRINVFRLFRVLRLVRLLHKHKSTQQLLWTFMKSLRALPYVMVLIVLTLFMYAVVGMQFFGQIGLNNTGSSINRNNNFQTFPDSLLVLFRCITGESWQDIMFSCTVGSKATCLDSMDSCGSAMAYVYFPTLMGLCSFLILNLFVAVIMENFDYLTKDKSVLGPHHLEKIINAWSQYDLDASGRIKYTDLVNMLSRINPPLGFGTMSSQLSIIRNLKGMNIPIQIDGTVYFNAVLFAIVRTNLNMNSCVTESIDKAIKQYNDELRRIIKFYWKNTNQLLIDQIIPKNMDECMTVGKVYAARIIEGWYKRCIINKLKTSQTLQATNDQETIKDDNDNLEDKGEPKTENSLCNDEQQPKQTKSFVERLETYQGFFDFFWQGLKNIFSKLQGSYAPDNSS